MSNAVNHPNQTTNGSEASQSSQENEAANQPDAKQHRKSSGVPGLLAEYSKIISGLDHHIHDAKRPNIDHQAALNDMNILDDAYVAVQSDRASRRQSQTEMSITIREVRGEVAIFQSRMINLYGKNALILKDLGLPLNPKRTTPKAKTKAANPEPPTAQAVTASAGTSGSAAKAPAHHPHKPHKSAVARKGWTQAFTNLHAHVTQIISALPKAQGLSDFPAEYTIAWAEGLLNKLDQARQNLENALNAAHQDKTTLSTIYQNCRKNHRKYVLAIYACYGKTNPLLIDYGIQPQKRGNRHTKARKHPAPAPAPTPPAPPAAAPAAGTKPTTSTSSES